MYTIKDVEVAHVWLEKIRLHVICAVDTVKSESDMSSELRAGPLNAGSVNVAKDIKICKIC